MKTIILATDNKHKIKELSKLLYPIKCIPQADFNIKPKEETGLSFIENAILKARHASLYANCPAIADDSGLVVPALNGEPGIYSARFAGIGACDAKNIELLLKKLKDVPENQRQAFFYCAIAVVTYANSPTPLIATGELHGCITTACKGAHGFGYDPVFFLPNYNCTLAEIDIIEKNKISHRGMALNKIINYLN